MESGPHSSQAGIQEPSVALAVRTLKLVRPLPRDTASQVIARQIARSGTSVGANVEEAQGSHSKAEFIRRMNIARTEALETRYWLKLIVEAELLPGRKLGPLLQEADELVRILVAIVKRARGCA